MEPRFVIRGYECQGVSEEGGGFDIVAAFHGKGAQFVDNDRRARAEDREAPQHTLGANEVAAFLVDAVEVCQHAGEDAADRSRPEEFGSERDAIAVQIAKFLATVVACDELAGVECVDEDHAVSVAVANQEMTWESDAANRPADAARDVDPDGGERDGYSATSIDDVVQVAVLRVVVGAAVSAEALFVNEDAGEGGDAALGGAAGLAYEDPVGEFVESLEIGGHRKAGVLVAGEVEAGGPEANLLIREFKYVAETIGHAG